MSTPVEDAADRNSSHLAGEYFVAAELYRRGYSVAITLGNAKAIDLFAEKHTHAVNIQVKAIRAKSSVGWPMVRYKVLDGVIYSVRLPEPARHGAGLLHCDGRGGPAEGQAIFDARHREPDQFA